MSKRIASIGLLVTLLISVLIGGLYWWVLNDSQIKIPLSQVELFLSQHFPVKKKFGFPTVRIDVPKLSPTNNSKKIKIRLPIAFQLPIAGTIFKQELRFSSAITYDPKSGQLFLSQVTASEDDLSMVPQKYHQLINTQLYPAVQDVFKQFPIYTLKKTSKMDLLAKRHIENIYIDKDALLIQLKKK